MITVYSINITHISINQLIYNYKLNALILKQMCDRSEGQVNRLLFYCV